MGNSNWRIKILIYPFVAIFLLICYRLLLIQSNNFSEKYIELGKNASYNRLIEKPERGLIFDRHGRAIAKNQTVYQIGVNLNEVKDPEYISDVLKKVLDISIDTSLWADKTKRSLYIILADRISEKKYSKLSRMRKKSKMLIQQLSKIHLIFQGS